MRKQLLSQIATKLHRHVVAYMVSCSDPAAMMELADGDILEQLLRRIYLRGDKTQGLTLILNTPGGDGLAAERIVRVCRAYSGGDFDVLVPRMAKSAGTMVCFGANTLWMSTTAELGPVDPQISWLDDGRLLRLSVHDLLQSYETLLSQAASCQGNIEPYLQQLSRYDARLIETYRAAEELSSSLAVNLLSLGMMRDLPKEEIYQKILLFLDAASGETQAPRSHGRAIYAEQAAACGLSVRLCDLASDLWADTWAYYLQATSTLQAGSRSKILETVPTP